MMGLLEVNNLTGYIKTHRGNAHILNSVNFSVDENECFGIIGESGSGKTMTALAVLRYAERLGFKAESGGVTFGGEDVLSFGKKRLRLYNGGQAAYIPQDPMTSLDPLYTIENQLVETLCSHQKITKLQAKERLCEITGKLQITEEKLKCYPFQLSGGMLQRVAGAAALLCGPRLIIADEPTTALDVTIQLEYLKLLKHIQKEFGTAIIFISHDIHAVSLVCDRIAVMYAGRVVETAAKDDLLGQPLHPYAKALIESANLSGEAREKYKTIDGTPPDLFMKPVGCPFADRCPHSGPRCYGEEPPLVREGENHDARCWRFA